MMMFCSNIRDIPEKSELVMDYLVRDRLLYDEMKE